MYGNVYNNFHLSVVLVRRGKNSVVLFCLLSSSSSLKAFLLTFLFYRIDLGFLVQKISNILNLPFMLLIIVQESRNIRLRV